MNTVPIHPQSHIFLWDLHEVILEKDLRHWIRICAQFDRKKELLCNLNKKSIKIFMTFILERLKLIKKQMVSEELIAAARTTKNEAFVELIISVCSSYKPISQTIQLMNDLSLKGYKHHLGSNIGQTVFNNCLDKYPHIFNLFEDYTIPFNDENNVIIKKPHPAFFLFHAQKHNLNPKSFIFIDDRKNNVEAALSTGMHAFHFQSAQQLRSELSLNKIL